MGEIDWCDKCEEMMQPVLDGALSDAEVHEAEAHLEALPLVRGGAIASRSGSVTTCAWRRPSRCGPSSRRSSRRFGRRSEHHVDDVGEVEPLVAAAGCKGSDADPGFAKCFRIAAR